MVFYVLFVYNYLFFSTFSHIFSTIYFFKLLNILALQYYTVFSVTNFNFKLKSNILTFFLTKQCKISRKTKSTNGNLAREIYAHRWNNFGNCRLIYKSDYWQIYTIVPRQLSKNWNRIIDILRNSDSLGSNMSLYLEKKDLRVFHLF